MATSKQLETWRGRFGNAYVDRNAVTPERIQTYTHAFAAIWRRLAVDPPTSILECGCNVGLSLRALRNLTDAALSAIEPNEKAREVAAQANVTPESNLHDGSVQDLPFNDLSFDLVFTSGVLIHVAPEDLNLALDELARVSKKYVLLIEYFARELEPIPYRGQDDMLWKADYGRLFISRHPSWAPVDAGFFWEPTTGFDDSNWWLFMNKGFDD